MSSEEKTRLSTGKWSIAQDDGVAVIYAEDEMGKKEWVASTTDPKKAMDIVEGLILVEHKRFYKPGATPVFESGNDRPLPPFLKRSKSS